MNKLLICAAALGLLISVPASAQKDDHNGDKKNASAPHADRGSAPAGNNQRGQGHSAMGNAHAKLGDVNQNANKGVAVERTNTRSVVTHQNTPAAANSSTRYLPASGDAHRNVTARGNADRGLNNSGMAGNTTNQRPTGNSRQANTFGNTAGHQADISSMRRNMQAPKHFRNGNYNAPQGYQYRHWSYGERLPRSYYVSNYWIGDFMMFGLFAPPSDLVWVRVGDDALLIDRDTGEIVQVRYGVFY